MTARLEGRGLGSAIAEIRRRLFKEVKIPAGTEIEFGGTYQIQQESFLALTQVLVGIGPIIFIILVCEFRSFSHPLAILAATILCGFGALLAIWVTGQTLNVSSFMGTIMVVGIVHKNGILMLDAEKSFTRERLRAARGHSPGGKATAAAHPDDRPGHHLRHAASCNRRRLGSSTATTAGHRSHWRRRRFHGAVAVGHAGSVLHPARTWLVSQLSNLRNSQTCSAARDH